MRALVLTGPGRAEVQDVPPPVAGAGQVVVDVQRAGVCGTDVEFFTGAMAYLHQGHARYPMRLGHEWCGTVRATGKGVPERWLGRRVTGDTMLGCGDCARCRTGRQHLCARRYEIGIRGGWPGALAEQLPVPVAALYELPDTVDVVAGALVEPGGSALRAVEAAALHPGQRLLVWGSGTIGLLATVFALSRGVEVHVAGRDAATLRLARDLGAQRVWPAERVPVERVPADEVPGDQSPGDQGPADLEPGGPYDAVIDATNSAAVPAAALDLVEPGGRVVYIGVSGEPSLVDSRSLVFKDVTAIGILSASPGLVGAIEQYASGQVDPRPLVATTVGLDQVAAVLGGWRPPGAGTGPKIHVDPRR